MELKAIGSTLKTMQAIIRLCYRKIIDSTSRKPWDVAVFDSTHLEFYMQAQRIDPDGSYKTFQEFSADKQQAEQLQYLTSTGAIGYIRQLNDIIPDIAMPMENSVCLS